MKEGFAARKKSSPQIAQIFVSTICVSRWIQAKSKAGSFDPAAYAAGTDLLLVD